MKKNRKKNNKKLLSVILVFILVIVATIVFFVLNDKKVLIPSKDSTKGINNHYNEFVKTNKESMLYNEEYEEAGKIGKNVELTLNDIQPNNMVQPNGYGRNTFLCVATCTDKDGKEVTYRESFVYRRLN